MFISLLFIIYFTFLYFFKKICELCVYIINQNKYIKKIFYTECPCKLICVL